MNTLDDDLRTMLARQAAAMQVQTPIEDRPLVRVTPPDPRGERRWLLPAAAVVLVVMGGLALAIRRTDDSPARRRPRYTATPAQPSTRLWSSPGFKAVASNAFTSTSPVTVRRGGPTRSAPPTPPANGSIAPRISGGSPRHWARRGPATWTCQRCGSPT